MIFSVHACLHALLQTSDHLHTFKLLNSELCKSNKKGNNFCKAGKQLQCDENDVRADLRSWGVPLDHTMLA